MQPIDEQSHCVGLVVAGRRDVRWRHPVNELSFDGGNLLALGHDTTGRR
jgi:hypothetical protein